MPYPSHLLPQPDFVLISWRNELRQYYLMRSVPTLDFMDVETGKVRAKYVNDGSREHLKDYSVNLLGVFTYADAAIGLEQNERKPYLAAPWIMGSIVEPPMAADFHLSDTPAGFFYAIGTIQDYPQPFSIAGTPGYLGQCYVCHTPTNANFWHFSMRWKIGQTDVAEALTESQRKNLLGLVRAFLVENALLSLPDQAPQSIPIQWYYQV